MIYIVRHGETDWNRRKIIQGSSRDNPLNKKGIKQAEKLARYFSRRHLDVIMSSPLKRAMQTAFFVAEKKKMKIVPKEEFIEIHYGEWSGKKSSEIPVLFPDEWKQFLKNPARFKFKNGESVADLYERVSRAFEQLEKDKDILIVTHTNPIRMIIAYILNMDISEIYKLHFGNCSVTKVKFGYNRWEVDSLNCNIT